MRRSRQAVPGRIVPGRIVPGRIVPGRIRRIVPVPSVPGRIVRRSEGHDPHFFGRKGVRGTMGRHNRGLGVHARHSQVGKEAR